MGQGQESKAVEALHTCQSRGFWLLLQNCHLLTRWLRELEKELDRPVRPHPDFRLWLTTDPTPHFPIGITQRCFKVVSEPPSGLKRNMKLTFTKITARDFTDCKSSYFGPIVYTLSFFHAVVQERKRFGKLGWNLSYEFNESDFLVCSSIIKTYLNRTDSSSQAKQLELELLEKKIPWNSLKYLISQVMYGGRVSDEFDRRILTCYLDEYMGDWLFDDFSNFSFFTCPSLTIKLPEQRQRDALLQGIEQLPTNTQPGVLGLNDNAEIDHFTQAAKALWEQMLTIAPNTNADSLSKAARDDIVMKAAAAIIDKLPPDFVLENVKKQYRMQMSPPVVVLLQELHRFNVLIGIVRKSLKLLDSAMRGEAVMTNELDEIGNAVQNGVIPSSWRRAAPETRKALPFWLEQLQQRFKQYEEWILVGELPVVWLAGIHVPASLITALIQSACRKNNWPLDRTLVSTEVSDISCEEDLRDMPKFGCYFSGLFLEGAAWSQEFHCLIRQPPKQLWCILPLIKITPIESHRVTKNKSFHAPVYATAARQNAKGEGLVFELDLPTEAHASWWTLQGVAGLVERD